MGGKGWRQLMEAGAGIGGITLNEFLSCSLSCSARSWKFDCHRKPIIYIVCLGCKLLLNIGICCFDLVWVS